MACLMNLLKVPVQTLVKTLNLGTLSLGKCRLDAGDPAALSRMFTLKKNGMDYVGQVRVRPGSPAVRIEVFNESYFEEFDQSEAAVLDNLAEKVLGRLLKDKELPEAVKTPILEYIEDQEPVSEEEIVPIAVDERDLDEIFERMNQEYLNDKVQAKIMWGRDVK